MHPWRGVCVRCFWRFGEFNGLTFLALGEKADFEALNFQPSTKVDTS
jgi:hypothetical protein